MSHDLTIPVGHVSETAYMVAAYRMLESRREDAHFHDDLAVKLLGGEAEAFLTDGLPLRFGSWMMAVRTCIIDRWIEEKVKGGVDMVVNLAAGLDTRPYRLTSLPEHLQWVEVDFAPIIDHKNRVLAETASRCQLERMAIDLNKPADLRRLFAYIEEHSQEALILTEGLLIYLEESTVKVIADGLRGLSSVKWWISECNKPQFMQWAVSQWQDSAIKQGEQQSEGTVDFRFVPNDLRAFFAEHGWLVAQFCDYADASTELNRKPPASARYPQEKLLETIAGSGYALLHKSSQN